MAANSVTFDFSGSSVLVSGGTSGIGYAVASAFADRGAEVTVTGTRESVGSYDGDAVDLGRFSSVRADMRDIEAIDALAGEFDVLDVLVNNAGTAFPDGLDEWTPAGFRAALETNLEGAFRLSTGLKPALRASTIAGGASVVNIASMSAFRAVPMVPGYSAAKAALVATTRNMALAWIGDGIRVNAVAPGLILTRMTEAMTDPSLAELTERELARIPAGRMGTPEEVAAMVLFLATGSSSYTTAATFAVDGGYLAF